MTGINEESGSLDDMLGKVAGRYEAAVDNAVNSLSTSSRAAHNVDTWRIGRGLMIAMYLPTFMLGSVI